MSSLTALSHKASRASFNELLFLFLILIFDKKNHPYMKGGQIVEKPYLWEINQPLMTVVSKQIKIAYYPAFLARWLAIFFMFWAMAVINACSWTFSRPRNRQ